MIRRSDDRRAVTPGNPVAHRSALLALLLVALVFAAFWPVARNHFVNYDDPEYVTANSQVQKGLTWEGVTWAFTTAHSSNWHPLTWVSHMADVRFFGNRPGPQHLVSILLHAANASLLFLFLYGITGRNWRSWFASALFALHPLHVESVAWVAERKDVLSTLFFLLTLIAYARYCKRSMTGRYAWYAVSLSCFVLGLLSKPMLVTTPFILLLLDFWPLRRFDPGARAHAVRLGRLVLEKVPFFLLTVGSSIVTFLAQREGGAVAGTFTFAERVGNALVSYARYLGKMLWPVDLAVLYPHPGKWPLVIIIASVLLLSVLSFACFRAWRSKPYLLFGWAWFLGTLVPVIGLVQVGMQAMADRYTYIPLIGPFVGLVWLIADFRGAQLMATKAVFVSVALICCGALTLRQIGYWHDSKTLFEHALQVTEKNYLAYNNLGCFYGTEGKTEEEIANYAKSLEINPNYREALNNMGCALSTLKKYEQALPYFQSALSLNPNDAEVHFNLGNALSELGRLDEAVAQYRAALRLSARPETYEHLGLALARTGELQQAAAEFKRAIELRPDLPAPHANLGNAYAMLQQWENALKEYSLALKLNATDAQTQYNMAGVLVRLGRWPEAVNHYRQALRLDPQNADVAYRLGDALLRQGDREAATSMLELALRLKPGYVEAANKLRQIGSPQPGR